MLKSTSTFLTPIKALSEVGLSLQTAGGHTLVYFQEVGGAVFARQCLVSKVTRDSDSETETDITNSTHTDTPNIAEIDNRKFYVTFYLYTS